MARTLPLAILCLGLAHAAHADDDWEDDDDLNEETEHDEGDDDDDLDDVDPDETCLEADPSDCLWPLGSHPYTFEIHHLNDADALGYPAGRDFQVGVYLPESAGEELPVVIVSHGGGTGIAQANRALPRWSRTLVESGYVVVSIAHPTRTPALQTALCELRGYTRCGGTLAWDRLGDIQTTLDFIEDQADGPWDGLIDADNIGALGFSAGANAMMVVGGASRDFGIGVESHPDERIRAIAAMSPAGPSVVGFSEDSWVGVELPVLLGTGAFDLSDGGQDRDFAFYNSGEDQKYLIYHQDPGAVHGMFSLNLGACAAVSGIARCRDLANWTRTSVVAFFDQALNDDEEADHWLSTDSLAVATDGAVDLIKRHNGKIK